MKVSILIIFISLSFSSCIKNESMLLANILDGFKNKLSNKELYEFKIMPKDSIHRYCSKFDFAFKDLRNDEKTSKILEQFFNKEVPIVNKEKQKLFLLFALHNKLNEKLFNNNDIINDCYGEVTKY